MINEENKYELIKFEDGEFNLDVNVSPNEDTVWLTQAEMALLFDVDRTRITRHVNNILKENELPISVCAEKALTATDGKIYITKMYNLDMIIAVGYRVNSKRGTLFRRWANQVLKQYLINGYSINDKRCLDCQENIISLNNKVNSLIENNNDLNNRLLSLEYTETILSDKLFYEGQIFDAYSYIKKLLLRATTSITIVDGYIDISVLDMLNEISLPIIMYTLPSANITNQDISKFQINHNLTIIRTNKIHDRFIIIDDDIYSIGSSIKDVGKKRFVMVKLESINKNDLLRKL